MSESVVFVILAVSLSFLAIAFWLWRDSIKRVRLATKILEEVRAIVAEIKKEKQ